MSHNKSNRWQVGTLTYTTAGLMVLFCWLLWGDFAWSLKERAVPAVLQLQLKRFEASDFMTGLLIGSLPGILAMIIGPIVSYRSDRHRGRWGRRIPYLFAPTPIVVISLITLAFSPTLGEKLHHGLGSYSPGLNATTLVLLGMSWTAFEFSSIIANSVFGGLINDVVPTPVLGRFYSLFRALSLIAGMLFNFWLLGKAETHFLWIFLGLAVIYGVGFTAMCLKVKEGTYEPHVVHPGNAGGLWKAIQTYFGDCFGHSYYWWHFIAMALMWSAVSPPSLFGVYFAKSLNMNMDVYGKCFALMYLISLLLAYPIGLLADRFHPLRLGLVMQTLFMLITLWGGLFARDVWTFSIAFVAQGVCAGAWMTATASINQRLLPKAKFAQFASAAAVIISIASITVAPIVGYILDYTHHTYRYIFLACCVLSLLSLGAGLNVYRKFKALGGTKNYIAPYTGEL